MEFGSFMEFPPVGDGAEAAAFDQALAEVEAAERYGLDAVWLAELHGAPERSVMSAPMMVASAIAARTSRIRIGIAVQVLPLSHPLRLAEEAATIDQISHGRLIYGIGRSGVVRTYEDYGISYGESRERFAETLEILKRAWTEPAFSYDGKYHSFKNVSVSPKPYQKPYPELRMAAATPETFPQIGRLGLPIFVAVRQGPFSQLAEHIRAYRAAYEAAGHPGRGPCGCRPISPRPASAPAPRPRTASWAFSATRPSSGAIPRAAPAARSRCSGCAGSSGSRR
jgi:alkanesulfonate monooxygenase SsuD/methylene tetrahydromethanopterin reductase-like flavin-dependent oxidoreductase (luciferase family)